MSQQTKEAESLQAQICALNEFIGAQRELQTLFDNSAAWADSRMSAEQSSRRNAWRVACGMGALTLIAFIGAGSAMRASVRPAPPPEILVVDRLSGKVEPLISLAAYQAAPQDVSIRRCVATFMRARENYSFDTAEENYRDAAAFMSAPLAAQWVAYWDTSNPLSPLNTYKKEGKVRIEIGAITINRSAAGVATSVRASFTRTVKRNDQVLGTPTAWIATIAFHWVDVPTPERERRVNDLGWQVTGYDVDADIGAAAGAPSALAAPPSDGGVR